jgi:hypothetical protein
MTEKDAIEFTDRERFIVSYYRCSEPASPYRRWLWDGVIVGASLACVGLLIAHDDMAFGFVAYGLVMVRLLYLLIEGRRWSREFRGIITKYESKVKQLTETLQKKDDPAA